MTDPNLVEDAKPPSRIFSDGVTTAFSRMRVRYLFAWLVIASIVIASIVIPVFAFLIHSFGPEEYVDSSSRELLSRSISQFVVLLVLWRYLRQTQVSWKRLLGPLPPRCVWLPALRLVPLLIVIGLAGFFVVAYPLSYLAPHVLDELSSMELFLNASNEQHQWFYELVTFLHIVVLVPVSEEVLFRGVLLHRWAVKWNLTTALLTSSFLFAIGHGPSVIGATVFGLVMAMLYIKTGSLLVPVVVHAASNAILCVVRTLYLVLPSWAPPDFWSSAAEIRNTPWLGVLFLVLSVPPMLYYLSRHWPRKSAPLPYFRGAALSAPAGASVPGPG